MSDNLDISHVARLARLKLSEEEAAEFTPQLQTIISHIDSLNELDVSGVEPSAHSSPVFAIPRLDEPGVSLSQESLQQIAPSFTQEQVRVPRVVES